MRLNAERDQELQERKHAALQGARSQSRAVRDAAAALLRLAYCTAEDGSRLTQRDIMRDLRAVRDYGDRRWPFDMAPVGRGLFPSLELEEGAVTAESFRDIRRELQCALAILVLRADRRHMWMPPSPKTIAAKYYAASPGRLLMHRNMTPAWLEIVYDAANVLEGAMLWFRCCELCSRLFFKVKQQRFCGNPRCESVFYARAAYVPKGDDAERRGRKRKDYAAVFERAHGAWLQAAVGPLGASALREQPIVGERRPPPRRRPASSSSTTTASDASGNGSRGGKR